MSEKIKLAAIAASDKWSKAFNSGSGLGCTKCYEEDAVMVAKPFGTFKGHEEIQKFWDGMISDGFADVEYIDRKIEIVDDQTAVITAGWKMNKAHGLITKEIWALQPDGSALLREDHFEAQD